MEIYLTETKYKSFIDYAFRTCNEFSFVYARENNYDADQYKIFLWMSNKSREINIGYHPESGTYFDNANLEFFICNNETRSAFISCNNITDWDGIQLPEEICFYRNGEKWFLYITHENCTFLFNSTDDDLRFLDENEIPYYYFV